MRNNLKKIASKGIESEYTTLFDGNIPKDWLAPKGIDHGSLRKNSHPTYACIGSWFWPPSSHILFLGFKTLHPYKKPKLKQDNIMGMHTDTTFLYFSNTKEFILKLYDS